MKITKAQLKQIIKEEIKEAFGYRKMYSRQPARGVGNLTIDDVQELLPHLSPGEQTDVWEKYKHLNSQDDLRRALGMNEQEGDGWPTVPPGHPKGSTGVCIQNTRAGTKKLYKGDPGYEECLKSKKVEEETWPEKESSGELGEEKENCFSEKYTTFKGKSKCIQRTQGKSEESANAIVAKVLRDKGEIK